MKRSAVASSALALAAMTFAVGADMIRPTSATATTRFSAAYDVSFAINGAGLPKGFTPDSPHATYTTNNHWTTAANRTVGESATFNFATPTRIGGFYMWAHRSNNIATNPNYAVTRFDLVFRDAENGVLQTLVGLPGEPDVTTAQRYAFDVVENVSSIQFIIRATRNGDVSPYSGLAEVAFDTCIAATTPAPLPRTVCPGGSATLTTTPFGSGPLETVWQVEAGASGSENWINLADGEMPKEIGGGATISGAATASLTISDADAAASRRYRLTMSNPCGDATSEFARITVCDADFNCDSSANSQDFFDFLSAFFDNDPSADFNGDDVVNSQDFFDFLSSFFGGC